MKNLTIADILKQERVKLQIEGVSKKHTLELVSQVLANAQEGLESWAIFDVLLARERLGSTGVGRGIAIPHGKLAELKAPIGCFLRLITPVDFNSPDGQDVSMIFAILVPEGDEDTHLAILSQLARRFSDPEFCAAISTAENTETAFSLLTRKITDPSAEQDKPAEPHDLSPVDPDSAPSLVD